MQVRKTFQASLGAIVVSTTGAQAEWRYCYALDATQHRFYMSAAFSETKAMDVIEEAFRRQLAAGGLVHQNVACPRGDNRLDIQDRMQHAASYNRANGNTVIPLDWADGANTSQRDMRMSPQ